MDGRYLFDAPPTLLPHLNKLGKDAGDIEAVFISHFHGDHFFGLPFLLLEYAEMKPRVKDLTIVGPPGIAKRSQSVTDLAFSNVFRKDRGYHLTFVEAKDARGGDAGGAHYFARKVQHVPNLEAFGYRVSIEGRTIAYSGDTAMCDALVPLADGADAFVLECSCWNDRCGPIHLTPDDVLSLRAQVSKSTTFIITHMAGGDTPQQLLDAGILVAEDLKTIVI